MSDRLWVPGEVHKKKREKGTPPDPEKGTLKEGGDEKHDEKG